MGPFVQGDTAPSINSTIHARGNPSAVVDLTGCEVHFQMRKADDRRFTVNNVADIVDEEAGAVRYDWGPNDLSVPGEYIIQWQVTYPDAKVQTTADPEVITVRRQ